MIKEGPPIAVLKADGINCENEMMNAFRLAGARPELVHINQLREGEKRLVNYQGFIIPGGFSYGDDIASGAVLGVELNTYLADQLDDFVQRDKKLVLGVCNGFQVLTRSGLLPFGHVDEMRVRLADNDSGHFSNRWVNLKVEENTRYVAVDALKGKVVEYPVAHGEGKFKARPGVLEQIEESGLVVFRYCSPTGEPVADYPHNPNGAVNSIAGICDETGLILGLMPHPERFVEREKHPNWRRMGDFIPHGLPLIEGMVEYASQM